MSAYFPEGVDMRRAEYDMYEAYLPTVPDPLDVESPTTEDEAAEAGDWAGAEAALDAVARRFPTAAVRPASLLGRREARADARRDAPRPGTGGPDRE